MGKLDKDKTEKVGDFMFRYMRARHRFKEKVERPLPSNELAALIGLGKQEFDEIYIEPGADQPHRARWESQRRFRRPNQQEVPRDPVF